MRKPKATLAGLDGTADLNYAHDGLNVRIDFPLGATAKRLVRFPHKADLEARALRPRFRTGGFRVHRKACRMSGMSGELPIPLRCGAPPQSRGGRKFL